MVAPVSASGIPRPAQTAVARIIAGRDQWRAQLQTDYINTYRRLNQAYARSIVPIRARADALLAEYDRRYQANGGQLDFEDVRGLLTQYDLMGRVEGELAAFANYNRANGGTIANAAFAQGIQSAGQLAGAQLPAAARDILMTAWIEPDPGALRNLAVYVDGAAYTAAWDKFGQNAAQNLGDTLLTMMAQGKSPLETARYMSAWYPIPLAWAANSARTLQLYSYRAGQQFTYQQNSDVLNGWIWSCSRDRRTCVSCWAQDGKEFTVSDSLNDHHQGRCAMLPVVKGATWPKEYGTGAEFFAAQDESFQQDVMGKTLHEAFKAGKVTWADLGGKTYHNAILGEMRRAPTLRELGLRRKVIAVKPAAAQSAAPTAGGGPLSQAEVEQQWKAAFGAAADLTRGGNPYFSETGQRAAVEHYSALYMDAQTRGDTVEMARLNAIRAHVGAPPQHGETRDGVRYIGRDPYPARDTTDAPNRAETINALMNRGISRQRAEELVESVSRFSAGSFSDIRASRYAERGLIPVGGGMPSANALGGAVNIDEYMLLTAEESRYRGGVVRGLQDIPHGGTVNGMMSIPTMAQNFTDGYWYEQAPSSFSHAQGNQTIGFYNNANVIVQVQNTQSQGAWIENFAALGTYEREVLMPTEARFRVTRMVSLYDLPADDWRRQRHESIYGPYRPTHPVVFIEVIDEGGFDNLGGP